MHEQQESIVLGAGGSINQTTRGFIGEEEFSVSGLVHLSGRVYDFLLARFTSANTITEIPLAPRAGTAPPMSVAVEVVPTR
jgi:hypothetical protein